MVQESDTENGQGRNSEPLFADRPLAERVRGMAHFFFNVARIIWLLLSLTILAFTLFYSDGRYKTDATEAETIAMLALSFPSGWLVVALLVGLVGGWRHIFASELPELPFIVVSWVLWTVVGYSQWFLFIPWCARRLIGWRQQRRDHTA